MIRDYESSSRQRASSNLASAKCFRLDASRPFADISGSTCTSFLDAVVFSEHLRSLRVSFKLKRSTFSAAASY